jgi:hypothetical protein
MMMNNLNELLESLKQRMDQKATAIQDLSDEIELKQMEIKETEDMLSLLESLMSQLLEDRDTLLDEYDDLLNKARRRKVTSFMPSSINEFRTRANKVVNVEETEEKARRIIEKEEQILASYKVTEKINKLRYKLRKSPEEEQEYIDALNELARINNKIEELDKE